MCRWIENIPTNCSSNGLLRNVSGSNLHPEFQQMMEAMTASNRDLFHCSFREVLQDHDEVMERLQIARSNNDSATELFYSNLHKKLEAELDALA